MATRASSRGCLAVRGKKRLGRRRGAFQGRPRPRLRRPPCRTAAGGRWTPPPSQQPRARARGTPRASPRAASPVPAAVHLGAGQRSNAGAYPRSAPRGHRHRKAGTGTRDPSPLSERRASRRSARGGTGNLLLSQGPRWRRTVTYARSREGENARLGGARASASREEERLSRGWGGGGRPERRSAFWGRLSLGKARDR